MGSYMVTEYRYLDILWLDNVLMNYIILWVTVKVSKIKCVSWRLWVSAGIGALYAVFIFLPQFQAMRTIPLKICLSLIMLLAAFEFNNIGQFIKVLAFFYCTTFIFGGAAFGIYYFLGEGVQVQDGIFYIENYPVKILAFACIIVITLGRNLRDFMRNRLNHQELLYTIGIYFDGEKAEVEGLLDTGNALYDPISQNPVIVAEFAEVRHILPSDIQDIFIKSKENDLEFITKTVANSSWIGRFRMIPFMALGKENGMLIGFKPDKVSILMDGDWQETRDIIIGIYARQLSKDSEYHALINPQLIQ